jgi:hypothetical protein
MITLRRFPMRRLAASAIPAALSAGFLSVLWDKAIGGDWGDQPAWTVNLYYVLLGFCCTAAAAAFVNAVYTRNRNMIVMTAVLAVLSCGWLMVMLIAIDWERHPGFF